MVNKLMVSGVDLIDFAPLNVAPIRWSDMAGESWGNLSFTVEDTAATRSLQGGADVRLVIDSTNVFGGTLLRRRFSRMPGAGRVIECEAVSYDSWLDWRIVPQWSSRTDLGNRIRKLSSDRAMVKDLVERRGGPLRAPNSTVTETNAAMDVVRVQRKSLREALEIVGDEAQTVASSATRHVYVDEQLRVHYYSGLEGTAAPYSIADGSYVRDVIGTAGLLEYWSLREETGSTFYGSQGVTNMSLTAGTAKRGVTGGVVNEPAYRAITVDGAVTNIDAASVAGLKAGDSWSFECWLKRTESVGADILLLAFDTGPQIDLQADGDVEVISRGVGTDFVTTGQPITDDVWYHLVVAHGVGDTAVYVNGVSQAGTLTARVFGDTWTTFQVARAAGLVGSIQHVAWYTTQLAAATALAHYRQGISIGPEGLAMDDDWAEVEQHGYVIGRNRAGSGWG